MRFNEKYTNTAEREIIENKDKTVLSNDAYAVGEAIQMLIDKIEQTRLSFK